MSLEKEHRHAGAERSAGTGQPVEQSSVTARDVHLAKLENAGVGAENRRYRPCGSSGIGNDNSNSGDQVSRHVFKPGVETSPDYLLSGRPGSNCKPDDARPCYERRDAWNFHPPTMHEDPFQVLMQYPSFPLRLQPKLDKPADGF